MRQTSRQRVMDAMNLKKPQRVPFFYRDVPEVEERLKRDLQLRNREEILEYLEIDFRWVGPEYIGPTLEEDGEHRRDIWGVVYKYIRFHGEHGYWGIVDSPLSACESSSDLAHHTWPRLDWFDFSALPEQAHRYRDYALMTSPGYSSPGLLQYPIQALLGQEKAFIAMIERPDFFLDLIKRILDFQLPFIHEMLGSAKDRIDFFRIGDDYGSQQGLLISPTHWRQLIKPALKAMADVAKSHGAYYYQHSCGAIKELIPDFLELGLDVLDPIQVKAKGIIPQELKREYGHQISFSGGVDEQELLRKASPFEVKEAVFQLLEAMAYNGGFFIGPTHNFQVDIPTENILALYEAAAEWSSRGEAMP